MGRCTYVLRGGELIAKHLAPPLHAGRAAPMVRPDGMDPIRSMADGRLYDSRSAYYASVRAHGCEIVGDDRAGFGPDRPYRPEGVGRDIQRTLQELKAR